MPRGQRRTTRAVTTPVLHPHAAGVDVGATELYVCVPKEGIELLRSTAVGTS